MRYDDLIAVSGLALTVALAPLSVQAANIVDTLNESEQFSQLATAIEKAGLTETLQGEGPYTVFAPTDEAFQKLQQSSQGQSSQRESSQRQSSQGQSSQGQQSQSQQQGSDGKVLQQASSDQLKQILSNHVIEGQKLSAKDVLGKEQKVGTVSGDQLTVDGTGTMVVLVPTGLSLARVGDEVFVRREAAAMAQPTVTVSTTTEQSRQSGQQSSQGQQQSGGQSGQQSGQSQGKEQPMAEQQGLLRAAMVVEPDIEADNGVIHAIDQVLVPQKIEQDLMSEQGQSTSKQKQG
jgi:uncharacterized surface protein with fasciclin (FAS1) repeats